MSEFNDYLHGESTIDSMTNPYDAARESWSHQQAKIDELAKHVACIKTIVSECDEKTDSSWILGNIDGFIECMEKILNDQSN